MVASFNRSSFLEKSLQINQNRKKSNRSLLWGTINLSLLSIILYDLVNSCPLYVTSVQYVEYVLSVIFLLNILYHFARYFTLKARIEADDTFLKRATEIKLSPNASLPQTPPNTSFKGINLSTSLNSTWRSSGLEQPQNLSYSYHERTFSPISSSPYAPQASTPLSTSPVKLPPKDMSGIENITDEDSLSRYLQDFENYEKLSSITSAKEQPTNLLSSFWSHPATKSSKDVSPFFKRTLYQTAAPGTSSSPSNKPDDRQLASPVLIQGIEIWKRFNVNITTLTSWNENLRLWISKTILERLVQEIDSINEILRKHGFGDVTVGSVGLDRLRKTSQLDHVKHYIPSLATLIPFVEVSPNQEYLVNRIRELSKGGCMSDFTWNGGGRFNGKEWDPSLASDSAIVMHLFATYMDTQLMPMPNNPDAKPFTSYHFIKGAEIPADMKKADALAIQNVTERPPQYRVIVGEDVYELQGHNSLLYSLLFFLYQVNKREHGMLGRINLGKAGLNMLWIIES